MAKLLQIDFPFGGMSPEMVEGMKPLAQDIAQQKGLIWKIWTENAQENRAGGVYLFEDKVSAETYLEMHTERLKKFGIQDIRAMFFDITVPLSEITKAGSFIA